MNKTQGQGEVVKIIDGVERRTRYVALQKFPYPRVRLDRFNRPRHSYSSATYECDRCTHSWTVTPGETYPPPTRPCMFDICGRPHTLTVVWRQMRGKKIAGVGHLKSVTEVIYQEER